MIKIYRSDTAALNDCDVFEDYKKKVDDTRREKVERCRNEEDKKRSLLAGYLIQVGVREWIGEESGLHNAIPLSLSYTYGENGKPYLTDYPRLHFSLSHSGSYVIAAFSEEEVGIDIQYHKPMQCDIAERFFSEEDKRLLEQLAAEGEADAFYRLWAVKEAYMKLTGEGLRQGLNTTKLERLDASASGMAMRHTGDRDIGTNDVRLQNGRIIKKNSGDGAFFRSYGAIEKYSIAVCSYSEISDIKSREVEL